MASAKLFNPKEFGGLKLIDIKSKDTALKCQWVSKLKVSPSIANLAAQFLPPIGKDIWLCSLTARDIEAILPKSFWRDVLKEWMSIHKIEPDNSSRIAMQMLWYNSNIRI